MNPIRFIDRESGKQETEEVYGGWAIRAVYGNSLGARTIGRLLLKLIFRNAWFSVLWGWIQCSSWSRRQIRPFIEQYHLDPTEFATPIDRFKSFNDFFIRKLKPERRPIAPSAAVVPADGRYWFYQDLSIPMSFEVKGERFSIEALLDDANLAQRYSGGAMVVARLCPVDYHRFHFPCDGTPSVSKPINGWLHSVNPIAIKENWNRLSQHRRTVSTLETNDFGTLTIVEIGAINVGKIHQTYTSDKPIPKGYEKGFFAFGGSALILLFEPNKIRFDSDLLLASKQGLEIRCLMGQSMGKIAI